MNVDLSRDEIQLLRGACYLHTATCAVNREEARRTANRGQQAYWSQRHDAVKALGDRLEALVWDSSSAATSTADPVAIPGSVPSVGVAAECEVCGAPRQLADVRVRLCNECRSKLHKVLIEEVL